jgi:O-succinylbenzoic acid--CoA ligase
MLSQGRIRRFTSEIPPQEMLELYRAALNGDFTIVIDPENKYGGFEFSKLPTEIALLLPTSGSTGEPKLVALSSNSLIKSAELSLKYLQAKPGSTWSLLLPLTHIAGFNVLTRALVSDSKLVTEINETANFTAIVPTQLHRALNPQKTNDELLFSHLQSTSGILVGGAATSADLAIAAEKIGLNLIKTYGSSETSGGCVYDGTPLESVEIEIVEGLIKIKSPTLATGYLYQDHFQIDQFSDGCFQSNDLGKLENGKLTILGRADNVIISGGEKISLDHLENQLSAAFPTVQFLAGKRESAVWGEELLLIYQGGIELDNLKQYLLDNFPNYYQPKAIKSVPQIPLKSIGKGDRSAIPKFF